MKLIKLDTNYILVDPTLEAYPLAYHINKKEVLEVDSIGELSGEVFHNKGFSKKEDVWAVIRSTEFVSGSNSLNTIPNWNKIKELIEEDVWKVGNKLKITTNGLDHETNSLKTYEGVVIELDKGLALKVGISQKFKTQGTYWFGSVLQQKVELIEKGRQNKMFSESDMVKMFELGMGVGSDLYSDKDLTNAFDTIEKSNTKTEWEVEFDSIGNLKLI